MREPKPADSVDVQATVVTTDEVAEAFYRTRLRVPAEACAVQPGQFVQLRPRPVDGLWPFLRLPLSVAAVDTEGGLIDVLYEEVGPKTGALRHLASGEEVGFLGPLGNGFPLPEAGRRALLVGGGIGVPPLIYFGGHLRAAGGDPWLLVGARSAGKHLPDELLAPAAATVRRATDDGSRGHAGLVTDLLSAALDEVDGEVEVFTCGPHPMMAAVARICAEATVPCHASLEEYMACGFGVCVGCVVELTDGEAAAGPYGRYARVCVDGPVFDAARIVW